MKHPALNELKLIIQESNLSIRFALLEVWQEKWVYTSKHTQYIINKSILKPDEIDFVWYKVAQMCAEDLMDKGITENSTTNNAFSCETWALRSPNGKLKKSSKDVKKVG